METKTVYVPVEKTNKSDRQFFEKIENVIVMTKEEFEAAAHKIWDNAVERSDVINDRQFERYDSTPDFHETIKSIFP